MAARGQELEQVAESHILFFRQREKKRETEGEGLPACAFETAKPTPSDIVFFSNKVTPANPSQTVPLPGKFKLMSI